jgi:thiamine pyrophosphokinase
MLAVVFLNGEYAAVSGARMGGGAGPDGEADPAGPAAYYRALADRAELVIGADGGSAFALAIGATPDLVIGDFDSLAPELLARAHDAGAEIVRHPVRKDFTDAELAVDAAQARGCDEIVLAGALGGAADHLLGNVAVLRRLAEQGVAARIVSPDLCARVLCAPASAALAAPAGTRVSLLALTEIAEVTLRDFEYELFRGTLTAAACLGLGNTIAAVPARIEVHAGAVLVFVHAGAETFAATAAAGE